MFIDFQRYSIHQAYSLVEMPYLVIIADNIWEREKKNCLWEFCLCIFTVSLHKIQNGLVIFLVLGPSNSTSPLLAFLRCVKPALRFFEVPVKLNNFTYNLVRNINKSLIPSQNIWQKLKLSSLFVDKSTYLKQSPSMDFQPSGQRAEKKIVLDCIM